MVDRQTMDIFQKVLTAAVGSGVYILARTPHLAGVIGQVSKTYSGRYIMDIEPTLPAEKAYKTFLHELGHVVMGHTKTLIPSDYVSTPGGFDTSSLMTEEEYKEYKSSDIEQEADAFARLFDDRVNKKALQVFGSVYTGQLYLKLHILEFHHKELLK